MRKTAARGPAGPYTVERGINRDTYHDGPRNLSDFWNARPYADVESPHQDADAELDADRPRHPVRRVMINEETIRNMISTVMKAAQNYKDEDDDKGSEHGKHGPGTKEFEEIAPVVDYIADLMQGYNNREELGSVLESSGIKGAGLLAKAVKIAESSGFGYRDKAKSYGALIQMVERIGDAFLDPRNRQQIHDALDGAREAGVFGKFSLPYANAPDKLGFTQNPKNWKVLDTATQLQYYDPAAIGKLPQVHTQYVNYILGFLKGDQSADEMQSYLVKEGFINLQEGRFNTKRLNSVARYMTEYPDSPQAARIMVALMLKEVIGQIDFKKDIKDDGIAVSPALVRQNMSESTKTLVDRWTMSALAILTKTGMLPEGEDYRSARSKMLTNIIRTAAKIANPFVEAMLRRIRGEQEAAQYRQQPETEQPEKRTDEGELVPPGRQSSRDAESVNADVLKEIVAPTELRIVTPEEAEDGIEVGNERKLKFRRSRYHAVSGMFARRGGD